MKLCQRFTSDKEVLRNGKVRTKIDLLIHGGNSDVLGIPRGSVLYGTFNAFDVDLAGLKIVDTGDTLDQG